MNINTTRRMMNINYSWKYPLSIKLYVENYIPYRMKYITIIHNILDKYPQFTKLNYDIRDSYVIDIEKSCYESVIDKSKEKFNVIDDCDTMFRQIYARTCYRVICGLDDDDYIINQILEGNIDVKRIGTMTSEELSPTKYGAIAEKIRERQGKTIEHKTSTQYTCHNCGKNETIIRQVQIRALDEGANIAVLCVNCGKKWNI